MTNYTKIDNIWHDTDGLARNMGSYFYGSSTDELANGYFRDGNMLHYYKNGLLHRIDGPAKESLLNTYNVWYYEGKEIPCSSQAEFEKIIKLLAFV